MWGGRFHYKRTIIGPPAKRHLNGPTLSDFSGDPDQTQYFCDFSIGGGGGGVGGGRGSGPSESANGRAV